MAEITKLYLDLTKNRNKKGDLIATIYKIISSNDSRIYVGSTCCKIEDRLKAHLISVKNGSQTKHHCAMREVGVDTYEIHELEKFIVEDEYKTILIRERFYYDKLKPELNSNRPYLYTKERVEQKQNNKQLKQHYIKYVGFDSDWPC